MGLDTSHDCWHGAYSAFTRWRNVIAEVAGYKIVEIPYGGTMSTTTYPGAEVLMHERWTLENFQGEWGDDPPEDPLLVLLIHSDCEGIIPAKLAPFLAGRLEQLLPKLAEIPDDAGHIGNWQAKTQRFIDGLRKAAANDEDVEFG